MSIKKSKTNEAQPDFDDMMSEVEEELELQQIEQNIADRVPELRKLNENIDKATTAVINAKLSLESIHLHDRDSSPSLPMSECR